METPRIAAQPWSQHVPSPPRVIVPPPPVDENGIPDLQINGLQSYNPGFGGVDNTDFLSTMVDGSFWARQAPLDWEYKQRYTAQPILPFLFLGPITAARDTRFLQDNGITMILAVRDSQHAYSRLLESKVAVELGIPCCTVDTAGPQELIAGFPRGTQIINAHLSELYHSQKTRQGKVLVFCESGNERSAAMVVAYLMAMYPMDLIKAIQVVTARRFSAALNDQMKLLLQTYASILQAKRDVVRSAQQSHTSCSDSVHHPRHDVHSNKRTLDEADDNKMAVEGGEVVMAGARVEEREGAAPFNDPSDYG
ncbi:MAG: hypothetical protein Q9220_003371 [cf. Caloplaca sp. 1 TL-2023]